MKSPTNNIQMYDMCYTYEILLSIKIKGWSVEILFPFAKSSDVSEVCSCLCKARDFFKNPFIRFADAPHWQVSMRWGEGGTGWGKAVAASCRSILLDPGLKVDETRAHDNLLGNWFVSQRGISAQSTN